MKPVCLVLGAGAGIGGNTAHRFASEGYHVALCRRSNQEGLDNMVKSIESEGGSASGYILNAVKEDTIENVINEVENNIGAIEVVIFNLGAQIGDVSLNDLSYKQFELGWRMATFALFRTASTLFPYMEKRGKGTLIVTSSTASVRGNPKQHSHAAAMGGRRMLCQSLNDEFGPQGIHVANFIIDGAIDTAFIKENFPDVYALKEKDGILQPNAIADAYWFVHTQEKNAWTHELDLRPYMEKF